MEIDLNALKKALKFYDQGWSQWNDEKQLFIEVARAYLKLQEQTSKGLE